MSEHGTTLSVVVPTQGRHTLERCLRSIGKQLLATDECIVVADIREPLQQDVKALVDQCRFAYKGTWTYLEYTDGICSWGHSQIVHGEHAATCDWIVGLDDDDVHVPGAYAAIRTHAVGHWGPMLFRFKSHFPWSPGIYATFWDQKGCYDVGHIGGHCLVQPNVKDKLAPYAAFYEADQKWVVDTVANWGGDDSVKWVDHIIAQTRPAGMTADQLLIAAGLICEPVSTMWQVEQVRCLRNVCRDGFAHMNAEISEGQQVVWWCEQRGRVKVWLYWDPAETDRPVGFSMAKQDDAGAWWSTVGVAPWARGRGLGGTLTAHLVRVAGAMLTGEARRDNPAAVALHRAEDWEDVSCPAPALRRFQTRVLVNGDTVPMPRDVLEDWAMHGWARE